MGNVEGVWIISGLTIGAYMMWCIFLPPDSKMLESIPLTAQIRASDDNAQRDMMFPTDRPLLYHHFFCIRNFTLRVKLTLPISFTQKKESPVFSLMQSVSECPGDERTNGMIKLLDWPQFHVWCDVKRLTSIGQRCG